MNADLYSDCTITRFSVNSKLFFNSSTHIQAARIKGSSHSVSCGREVEVDVDHLAVMNTMQYNLAVRLKK